MKYKFANPALHLRNAEVLGYEEDEQLEKALEARHARKRQRLVHKVVEQLGIA